MSAGAEGPWERTWGALAWRPGRKTLAALAAEVVLIGTALPLYYLVRGVTHERVATAFHHAERLISLEQKLGIFWEADLQSRILSHHWLVDALNSMYLYGHQTIVFAVAVWLYFAHRHHYMRMRNAFLISGGIGLIVYASFPVAPPRFMPEFGFSDTVFSEYGVSRLANPSFFRNEYAAVPSLHFGWNLLAGVAIWLATVNIALRSFAVLMPLATLAAVVLTANHYILDAVAGLVVVATGMAIAVWLQRLVLRLRLHDGRAAWRAWISWLGGVAHHPRGLRMSVDRSAQDA